MMASSSTLNRAELHEPAEVPRLVNCTAARLEARYRAAGEAEEIGACTSTISHRSEIPLGPPRLTPVIRAQR